jgi:hypothetical protein
MDRVTIYPGAIPLETDLLQTNRNMMVAMAKIAAALIGTSTQVNGLACAPTGPPTLAVQVSAGEIYSMQSLDATAYSTLLADTTHSILKQGISLDTVTLACPAPVSVGQSINYLVEVGYQDIDSVPVVLPYYNSANPAIAYSGPANSGAPNYTNRKGACVIQLKAGTAAATGSQTTPGADTGFVGLYVVTVAYGATTVVTGNISTVSGAPFMVLPGSTAATTTTAGVAALATLAEAQAGTVGSKIITPATLAQAVQSNNFLYGNAAGTANALTLAVTPNPASLYVGMEVTLKVATSNTGAATLNLNGLGAKPILFAGAALSAGLLTAGYVSSLVYDGASWQLQTPQVHGIVSSGSNANGKWDIWSNGRIEQRGVIALASGATNTATTITFPIAFASAPTFVGGNPDNGANGATGSLLCIFNAYTTTTANVTADSANSAQTIAAGRNAHWLALS